MRVEAKKVLVATSLVGVSTTAFVVGVGTGEGLREGASVGSAVRKMGVGAEFRGPKSTGLVVGSGGLLLCDN